MTGKEAGEDSSADADADDIERGDARHPHRGTSSLLPLPPPAVRDNKIRHSGLSADCNNKIRASGICDKLTTRPTSSLSSWSLVKQSACRASAICRRSHRRRRFSFRRSGPHPPPL
uniref:Uncharacterized protein n=1 Tax=Oryza sativa subsp. japonica TaxID=39947 RepID=Q9FWQ1_ORYSJ|nr:hypothetical protein [Oryza sativa Japonica Group]